MQFYFASFLVKDDLFAFFSGDNYRLIYEDPHLCEFREEYRRDLKEVIGELASYEGRRLIVKGGEPTLQRAALIAILKSARTRGLSTVLVSNLTKPAVIEELLETGLLDSLRVRFPAPFGDRFKDITRSATFFMPAGELIADIKESLDLLADADVDLVFSTTVVPGILYKKEDLLKIAEVVSRFDCRWLLMPFYPDYAPRRMADVNSPSERFLLNLRDICQKHHPQLRIDISSEIRYLPERAL